MLNDGKHELARIEIEQLRREISGKTRAYHKRVEALNAEWSRLEREHVNDIAKVYERIEELENMIRQDTQVDHE